VVRNTSSEKLGNDMAHPTKTKNVAKKSKRKAPTAEQLAWERELLGGLNRLPWQWHNSEFVWRLPNGDVRFKLGFGSFRAVYGRDTQYLAGFRFWAQKAFKRLLLKRLQQAPPSKHQAIIHYLEGLKWRPWNNASEVYFWVPNQLRLTEEGLFVILKEGYHEAVEWLNDWALAFFDRLLGEVY
jgi:hypothetical protein